MHLLQVQNPQGFISNDFIFFVADGPPQVSANLISSGGTFDEQGSWSANLTDASIAWDGEAAFSIEQASPQQWRVQLSHAVSVQTGVEYTICYSARAAATRYLQVNVDTALNNYRTLMGKAYSAEVGASTRGVGTLVTDTYHPFRHIFVASETDSTARLVFDLAQSDTDVFIDNVGLYRGRGCGVP